MLFSDKTLHHVSFRKLQQHWSHRREDRLGTGQYQAWRRAEHDRGRPVEVRLRCVRLALRLAERGRLLRRDASRGPLLLRAGLLPAEAQEGAAAR